MKVELNSATLASIGTIQNNKAESAAASANTIEGTDEDKTTLSTATSVGALTTAALASPEVRQDKVDALRNAIQNGSYQVEPGKIAEAMIRD